MSNKLRVLVPDRPLEPGGVPERCFLWVGSGLACKHWTRLERPVKDKLELITSIHKLHMYKFYNIGPWLFLMFLPLLKVINTAHYETG